VLKQKVFDLSIEWVGRVYLLLPALSEASFGYANGR